MTDMNERKICKVTDTPPPGYMKVFRCYNPDGTEYWRAVTGLCNIPGATRLIAIEKLRAVLRGESIDEEFVELIPIDEFGT